jgi:hypothetical protein
MAVRTGTTGGDVDRDVDASELARDRAGPSPPPARSKGPFVAVVTLLALVSVAVPIAMTRYYGALGIVRNDDWSYLRTLFSWTETGTLDFNNWVSMTLLTQLVMAAPIALLWSWWQRRSAREFSWAILACRLPLPWKSAPPSRKQAR